MTGMRFGYVRVSTRDQNPDRQVAEMEARGYRVYVDYASGKSTDRPELKKLMLLLREGDQLFVHSLDRLARNLSDLLKIVEDLTQRGVTVTFEKEKLEFAGGESASPAAKLMLSVVGAFSEFERAMIRARQREGIELAKARGVYRGRPRSVSKEKIDEVRSLVEKGVPLTKAARAAGISRTSAYRYLAKVEND